MAARLGSAPVFHELYHSCLHARHYTLADVVWPLTGKNVAPVVMFDVPEDEEVLRACVMEVSGLCVLYV